MMRLGALIGGRRGRLVQALPLLPVAALAAYVGGRMSHDDLAQGRQLYLDHCASCHGASLEGQPDWQVRLPSGRMPAPPHDASGHTWHHPDRVLVEVTKHGPEAVVGARLRERHAGLRQAPLGYRDHPDSRLPQEHLARARASLSGRAHPRRPRDDPSFHVEGMAFH